MGSYQAPASPAEATEREAARAAKLEQLHATLTEQVSAIRTGADWQRWLHVATKFPSLHGGVTVLRPCRLPPASRNAIRTGHPGRHRRCTRDEPPCRVPVRGSACWAGRSPHG